MYISFFYSKIQDPKVVNIKQEMSFKSFIAKNNHISLGKYNM